MHPEGIGATAEDVDRRVRDDFTADQRGRVWKLLGRLEADDACVREVPRVQLAALIVAKGDCQVVEQMVGLALTDYRDALVAAFYST